MNWIWVVAILIMGLTLDSIVANICNAWAEQKLSEQIKAAPAPQGAASAANLKKES